MKKVIKKQEASRADSLKDEELTKKSNESLDAANDTLKKGLTDDNGKGLNSNIIKLFKEVQKQTSIINNKAQIKPGIGAEQAENVTKKSLEIDQFKTIRERMSDFAKGFKEFFTLKGFLNKTGIVNKDSTGIVATAVNRRAARKQYEEDRMKVDPNYWKLAKGDTEKEKKANARATFGKQFNEQQEIRMKMRGNEGEISGLKERGFTEQQIAKSGLLKNRENLAEKMTVVDSRIRENVADKSDNTKQSELKSNTQNKENITNTANKQNKENITNTANKQNKENITNTAKIISINSRLYKGETAGNTKKQLEIESKKKQKDKDTIKEAMDFSDENQIEANRATDLQTEYLKQIAENTSHMAKPGSGKEEKKASSGGLLDTVMGFLGEGFMKAIRFLFNPKNILKALTKFLLPVMIIGSLVNGIMDGFTKFIETGSISEALIAGLGGILSFLTFGLFDADTIRSVVDGVSGFITDYIIEPLKKFVGSIGEAFNTYIAQPIMQAFDYIGNLFTEYIVDPIKKFFSPIADFFKKIKDQVFGFLEDFGIPEIGFTIPIIGKKVSIGPFYPFRPSEGTDKVSTNSQMNSSSSSAGESRNMKENIGVTNKDETTVFNSESKESSNGQSTYSRTMARFDPRTGKASYSNEDDLNNLKYDAPLTKGGFRQIKKASAEGADSTKIKEIVKEDEAYQKLGFFDKIKVDVGYAKASDLLAAQQPTRQSDTVYNKSSENAAAAATPPAEKPPVIVNAPTNVSNNKQNVALPQSIRNPDNGFNRYAGSRSVML
jgi:hypothetical protein